MSLWKNNGFFTGDYLSINNTHLKDSTNQKSFCNIQATPFNFASLFLRLQGVPSVDTDSFTTGKWFDTARYVKNFQWTVTFKHYQTVRRQGLQERWGETSPECVTIKDNSFKLKERFRAAQTAQRGSAQGQSGWGFGQPGLAGGVVPMAGGGTRWTSRFLPTQTILWL